MDTSALLAPSQPDTLASVAHALEALRDAPPVLQVQLGYLLQAKRDGSDVHPRGIRPGVHAAIRQEDRLIAALSRGAVRRQRCYTCLQMAHRGAAAPSSALPRIEPSRRCSTHQELSSAALGHLRQRASQEATAALTDSFPQPSRKARLPQPSRKARLRAFCRRHASSPHSPRCGCPRPRLRYQRAYVVLCRRDKVIEVDSAFGRFYVN